MTSTMTSTGTASSSPGAAAILDALTDWAELERRAYAHDASPAQIVAVLRRVDLAGRCRLALHYEQIGGTSSEVYAEIAADSQRSVRYVAARSEHTPVEVLKTLVGDRSYMVRGYLAANPACPLEIYRQFLRDPVDEVRIEVAQRELPFPDVLWLMSDPSPAVRCWVADRDDLTEADVRRLARDPEPRVRAVVAGRDTAPDIVEALANDPDPMVVQAVSRNRRATSRALCSTTAHPDYEVRRALIDHPRADAAVHHLLSGDRSRAVRYALARTTRYRSVLAALAADTDPGIRTAVLGNPSTTAAEIDLIRPPFGHIMVEALLEQRSATGEQVWPYLTSSDAAVRERARAAVRARYTTLEPVHQLVVDRLEAGIDAALLGTTEPLDDPAVVYWLFDTGHRTPAVWRTVLDERMPRRLREEILEAPDIPADVLEDAARSRHRDIRAVVAAHPAVAGHIARGLTRDRSVLVRETLAENEHCGREALLLLRRDPAAEVRRAAHHTLRTLRAMCALDPDPVTDTDTPQHGGSR